MQVSYIKKLTSKSVAFSSPSSNNRSQLSPLKHLRESRCLTQRYVAEYIGVTVQTISNLEREGYPPKLSAAQFSKLCELFDLNIKELAALWEEARS